MLPQQVHTFCRSIVPLQALPTFMEGFHIVVTSPRSHYTFSVTSNNATDLGEGGVRSRCGRDRCCRCMAIALLCGICNMPCGEF